MNGSEQRLLNVWIYHEQKSIIDSNIKLNKIENRLYNKLNEKMISLKCFCVRSIYENAKIVPWKLKIPWEAFRLKITKLSELCMKDVQNNRLFIVWET